jgi:DNA-directed RNA polymerase sigma subunit (sigma70/sigma32)
MEGDVLRGRRESPLGAPEYRDGMKDSRDERKRPKGYRGALELYLEAIRRFEFLTPSGEFRLATQSREQDEAARKALIEAYLRTSIATSAPRWRT